MLYRVMHTVLCITSFCLDKLSHQLRVERESNFAVFIETSQVVDCASPEEYVSEELYPKAMPISTLSFPYLLAKLITINFNPFMGTLLRLSGSFYVKDLDPNHLEKVNSVLGTEFKRNAQEGVTIAWKKNGGVDKALGT